MIGFRISDAAAAVGGEIANFKEDLPVLTAVRDNREVTQNAMFCAIKGERFDGHAFISDAFSRGASCVLASRLPEGETGCVILVPDVPRAMRALAVECRSRIKIPVIGVTGSSGKTTAKEMLARVLSRRFNTLKTEKNFNNELGVPLTLFGINPNHGAAVVELGISHFGDMTVLAEMARPDMAVYTMIGRSHLEALGDRQGVMRAKGELLKYMPKDGTVFVNGDDDILSRLRCEQRIVSFGLNPDCDVRAENLRSLGADGSEFDIVYSGGSFRVRVPAYGRHMVYAALSAAAVGLELGQTGEEIALGIADYVPVGSRASVIRTDCLTIIDDCYNANPDSTAMAILSARDLGGRLVCVLGDMLELGEGSEEMHRETGALARENADILLCTGERARVMGGQWFEDCDALVAALPGILKHGDTVLVKASHAMDFGRITEYLKTLSI